jgi:hypothetical protein
MKRRSISVAFASLAIAALSVGPSAMAGPPPPPKLPDLIITQFGLTSWGTCKPGKTVFTFAVTIKNQGAGPWVGTPYVDVRDLHPAATASWFSNNNLFPALQPGHSTTETVSIVYLTSNPGHMTSAAPHPFQAVVNPNHAVAESNYANNAAPGPAVYNGKKVIMVGAPKGCPKG